jgi:hypothetical protein
MNLPSQPSVAPELPKIPENPAEDGSPQRPLPFSRWIPLLVGVLYGIVLRIWFSGNPGGPYPPRARMTCYTYPLIV